MAEFVVTPQGRDAIEVGGFIDDTGARFIAMSFQRDGGDRAMITFTTALFKDFASHVRDVAHAVSDEDWWSTVPRL